MNRQHEDMVCAAASNHLHEKNWWGESSKVADKEMDDTDMLQQSNDERDSFSDGNRIQPHKAVFHAECCKDRNQ